MMTAVCMAGENPRLDLTQSYAWHSSCSGMAFRPDRDDPEPCSCPHHGMAPPRARRRRMSWRTRGRLVLAVAVLLAVAWAWLR